MGSVGSEKTVADKTMRGMPPCGFLVKGGKKGQLPIGIEKRPKGKKVTTIANVQGSAKSLLTALSSLLGVGGTTRQEASGTHWTIELQGDQQERVATALTQLGCLRGVQRDAPAKVKPTAEVNRTCGYDKFLRRKGAKGDPNLANYETLACLPCLPQAECFKWHGPWIYCRGNCVQADMDDVWEESLSSSAQCKGVVSEPPASKADLDVLLQRLGMLSEVGPAAKREVSFAGERVARQASSWRDEQSTRSHPASVGFLSLDQYRRSAVGPGARLVEGESEKSAPRRRRAASRPPSRPPGEDRGGAAERSRSCGPKLTQRSRVIEAPPLRTGVFTCGICQCTFSLAKTLKLHMNRTHPGETVPRACAVSKPVVAVQRRAPSRPSRERNESDPALDCHSPPSVMWKLGEAVSRGTVLRERRPPSRQRTQAIDDACSSDSACEQAILESLEKVGPPGIRHRVNTDYWPTGSTRDSQLMVSRGEEFVVTWEQPSEEEGDYSGYWAYGYLPRASHTLGYVPLANLTREDSEHREAEEEDAGAIPDAWFESFFMLELTSTQAEEFWAMFGNIGKRATKQAAWLQALEHVCGNMETASVENSRERVREPRLNAMGGDASPTEPKPSAQKSTLSSSTFAGINVKATPTQEARGGMAIDKASVQSKRAAPAVSDPGWEASQDSFPVGEGDNIQLRLRRGERFVPSWWQSPEEGGYWCYGHRKADPLSPGYVPISVLTPVGGSSSSRCARQPAQKAESPRRLVPSGSAPGILQETEFSLESKPSVEALSAWPAMPDASKAPESVRETLWQRRRRVAQPQAREVHSQRQPTASCPICGFEGDISTVTSHAATCSIDTALGEECELIAPRSKPSVSNKFRGPRARDTAEDDVRQWAEEQLVELAARFCHAPLDVSVALGSLVICTTAAEMSAEAAALIGDNRVVRNFAGKLWERRGRVMKAF